MTNVLNTLIQKCKKNNTQIKNIQDKIHLLDNSLQETQQNHEKLNNLTNTELQIFKNKILEDLNIIKQTMQTITPLIPDEAINEVKESLKKGCEDQINTYISKNEHRLSTLEHQYKQLNFNTINQTNKGTHTHTELYLVPFNHKYPESYLIHFLTPLTNIYNIIGTRGRATDL
uniref:Uncharacterized protein n=1 Tax=Clastoptera arizonana TaxID=38151 RepID=A0A1B6BXH6_9HEMI